jgi:hypothetical protein
VPVVVTGEAARELGVAADPEEHASRHRGVREVREDAVDAQRVELQALVDRAVLLVGREPTFLVAEGPSVDEETLAAGAPDQVPSRQQLAVRVVHLAVTILVPDLAVATGPVMAATPTKAARPGSMFPVRMDVSLARGVRLDRRRPGC